MNGDPAARFGVGMDSNIVTASLKGVISAVNRALRQVAGVAEENGPMRRVVGA